MAEATFYFPRGFLWGTATSSYQVEGNNTGTCWWDFEQEPGRIAEGHKSGLACDWWGGRWREDFDRAVEGYQNAHRLSIEWSRIQPSPDRWNEESLDRYREMLQGLRERNMTAMITLHHFNDPAWIIEMGGWENDRVVDLFIRYVRKAIEALGEYCNLWITINEPNLWTIFGYVTGVFPPGKKDLSSAVRVATNLVRAHAGAYRTIHRIQTQARVGMAHHYIALDPAKEWFPLDWWVTGIYNTVLNNIFVSALKTGVLRFPFIRKRITEAKGTHDFVGLNYYTRARISFDPFKPGELFGKRFYSLGAELSEGGWLANEPEGIFRAIKWAMQSGLPVIITECGVNDSTDQLRPRYMLQHLRQVWRAVNFNFPVKGFFQWTLVDNFEWERGWTQRFGLWALDPATQIREKRASADLYAAICKENGIASDVVQRYAPTLMPEMFPD